MKRRKFIRLVGVSVGMGIFAPTSYFIYLEYYKNILAGDKIDLSAIIEKFNVPQSIQNHLDVYEFEKIKFLIRFFRDLKSETSSLLPLDKRIIELIRKDYKNNFVVFTDGWVLSRTEVALSYLRE